MHRFENFCRLCAKESCSKNILEYENASTNLRETIEKHFSLLIDSSNIEPTKLCDDCYEFLLKLIDFEETVLRSQIKFQCALDIKEEVTFVEIQPYFEESFEEEYGTSQPIDIQVDFLSVTSDQSNRSESNLDIECTTRKFNCDVCGNKFAKPSTLLNHQKLVHSNVRKYICEECGKTFKRLGDLSRHKEFHRDDTPFSCRICDKKFNSKLVVAMHEKIHTEERFTCTICGQELKTKITLRGHMRTHSDKFQFDCEYCDKKFRHKKNLICHLLTHTGMKPYECAFCKQAFSLKYNLRTHQKKIHPAEMTAYEREGKSTMITSVVKRKFACGQRHKPAAPS